MNTQLKLLTLLCDRRRCSIKKLAELMGMTENGVRRILRKLDDEDFLIKRDKGFVELLLFSPKYKDWRYPLFLEEDESQLLQQQLQGLDHSNPVCLGLKTKLMNRTADVKPPVIFIDEELTAKNRCISYAIQTRRQVELKGYRSGSGGEKDHTVEPVVWSANYRQLYVWDVEKERMLTFVISRAKEVRVLKTSWQNEALHKVPEVDVFWMTGDVVEEVTLLMSQLALNLLREEFPLSRTFEATASGDALRPYRITLPTRQPHGAARFVMGMGWQCRVAVGERLTAYIEHEFFGDHRETIG